MNRRIIFAAIVFSAALLIASYSGAQSLNSHSQVQSPEQGQELNQPAPQGEENDSTLELAPQPGAQKPKVEEKIEEQVDLPQAPVPPVAALPPPEPIKPEPPTPAQLTRMRSCPIAARDLANAASTSGVEVTLTLQNTPPISAARPATPRSWRGRGRLRRWWGRAGPPSRSARET